MLLLLFDIDGTLLLKASGEHAASMHAALREVHGLHDPSAAGVAPAGRTDGDIARQILLRSGVSAERIDARAADVQDVCCREFGLRCPPDLRDRIAPGMPELLDDLAARFVANGWSLKWLHREIVLSAAYRQSSATLDRSRVLRDPDNRWLARMSRRRLEVEAWRDAMLAASDQLAPLVGGAPADLGAAGNTRRTLYGLVKRRELHDLLRLNDFPDPVTHSPARLATTTPLQQLFVLNSPFMRRQAGALVRRLRADATAGDEGRIRLAYALLFSRMPTAGELRLGKEFLATEGKAGWESYAQVLLGGNELAFID